MDQSNLGSVEFKPVCVVRNGVGQPIVTILLIIMDYKFKKRWTFFIVPRGKLKREIYIY